MSEAKPAEHDASAATLSAPPAQSHAGPAGSTKPKDVFGIVGTVQAGSFRVEEVVAEGGFGVVYRAQHGHFKAPVALKCLKVPGTLDAEQRKAFLEKFRVEGELLFRLSASIPQVVRPLHIDELELSQGGFVPFLALEWLEGQSLSTIIAKRTELGKDPLPLARIVALLQPIAVAMARAHSFPGPDGDVAIIHRDIKPENIFVQMVDGREAVRILDYGIAKARAAASTGAGRATQDDVNIFTPAYAAPEQWVPKKYGQTGPFTDVYGLALTIVEALVGHQPIDGELHTMFALALDEEQRPSPRTFGVAISDELEDIFRRALCVDPRARTQTIPAFWSDLERALGMPLTFRAPSHAPPTRVLPSLAPGPSSAKPESRPPAEAPPAPDGMADLELELGVARSEPRSVASPETPIGRADHHSFELDVAVVRSSGRPTGLRRRPHRPLAGYGPPAPVVGWSEVKRRLEGPFKILLFAAVITAIDILAVRFFGVVLAVGPVRASWVAAPLAVYAVVAALWRSVSD
jgi:eukaryotic-like serine/threonine-protein kinase